MKVFGNVDKTKDEHLNIYYSLEEKKAKRKDDIGREKGYLIIYIERDKGRVLANFFSTELQKALTEKIANTNLSTSDRKKDFIDSPTPKDVETRASCSGQNEGIVVF